MDNRKLHIPFLKWINIILQLRKRGVGARESGAFLLGRRSANSDRVERIIYYDDLDPQALDSGYVIIRSFGFSALWDFCRKYNLEVLGDVHTHPDRNAKQSETDRNNPMISKKGHIALIVPLYAQASSWFMQDVAVYEYAGEYEWNDWTGKKKMQRINLSLL